MEKRLSFSSPRSSSALEDQQDQQQQQGEVHELRSRGLLDLSPAPQTVPSIASSVPSKSKIWLLASNLANSNASSTPHPEETASSSSASCPQTALAVALHRVYAAKLQEKEQAISAATASKNQLEKQLNTILQRQRRLDREATSERELRDAAANELLQIRQLRENGRLDESGRTLDRIEALIEKLSEFDSSARSSSGCSATSIAAPADRRPAVYAATAASVPAQTDQESSAQARHVLRSFIAEPLRALQGSFRGFSSAAKGELSHTSAFFQSAIDELNRASKSHGNRLDILTEKFELERQRRRDILNELIELKGNIRVFVRIRPIRRLSHNSDTNPQDEGTKELEVSIQALNSSSLSLQTPERQSRPPKTFEFDRVFSDKATQETVFAEVRPLVHSCLDGYNACIFAYGQTGSGKTHTMEGPDDDPGVNFRALAELFAVIEERKLTNISYSVSVSILEIYNEILKDLLCSEASAKKLSIRLSSEGRVHVPDLTNVEVHDAQQVRRLCSQAAERRSTSSTSLNEHSSRSHSLVLIQITTTNTQNLDRTQSQLALIDLAGSERVSRSEAAGSRLREAQSINRSLSSLGDVMAALRQKSKHVPFRNSKLTFLLQDCLCGSGKTLMMCQVSPDGEDAAESLCSLKFAERVSEVQLGSSKRNLQSGELIKYKQLLQKAKEELETREFEIRESDLRVSRVRQEETEQRLRTQEMRKKLISLDAQLSEARANEHKAKDHKNKLQIRVHQQQREIEALQSQLQQQTLSASGRDGGQAASETSPPAGNADAATLNDTVIKRRPLRPIISNKSFMLPTTSSCKARTFGDIPSSTSASTRRRGLGSENTASNKKSVRFDASLSTSVSAPVAVASGTARRTRVKSASGTASRVRAKSAGAWCKY